VKLTSLPTPAVLVDQRRAQRNLDRMQALADARGIRLRPHSKTHKSPLVARWQIDRGAVGICCAKLGEAEVMAEAGIEDIRLPYPLNPSNADRVVALLDKTRLSFIVDHPAVARGWSDAMVKAGREVDVLVKVDVGFHRCGIDPALPGAARFVGDVASLPGLRFRGLLAHAGQSYHAHSDAHLEKMARGEAQALAGIADAVRASGVAVDELSAGATPTARFSLQQPHLTEYRPGNYVYFDRTQVGLGAAAFDDCALTVLTTVVSKPAADRIILDAGSKTLSNDGARGFGATPGYGVILRGGGALASNEPDETFLVERLSEEHATVRVLSGQTTLEPGDRVRVLPNHSCVVSNLVDQAWLVDGHDANARIAPLRIAARGRIS
jgi:D-serine deaminase-like pyridoxal phosphate-dependent protein